MTGKNITPMKKRFRGFLPVVVDVETGGLDAEKNALLEVAAMIIEMDGEGKLFCGELYSEHVIPFEGSRIDKEAIKINKIDIDHPFRLAKDEKTTLERIYTPINEAIKKYECQRAILVGHNAFFDLAFMKAASERTEVQSPFHKFSTLDTVTLGALAYGETILAKLCKKANIEFSQKEAHSAVYDTKVTAELFVKIVNNFPY